ncbi:MAG: hypothetical protein V2A73_08105, partial [Pseudomonadota bacterium]
FVFISVITRTLPQPNNQDFPRLKKPGGAHGITRCVLGHGTSIPSQRDGSYAERHRLLAQEERTLSPNSAGPAPLSAGVPVGFASCEVVLGGQCLGLPRPRLRYRLLADLERRYLETG